MNREYIKRYDPDSNRWTRQHIYGEGVMTDVFKSIGKKVFGTTMKEAAKSASKKAVMTAADKTGQYVGKKAGDKIVSLLQGNKKKPK